MPKFVNNKENKRSRVEESLQNINSQISTSFSSDNIKEYLDLSSRMYNYSLNNQMLIFMQNPDAQNVAGFNEWKNQGRYVKKGEKAIQILAPTTYNRKVKEYVLDDNGNRVKDENGNDTFKEVLKPTKGYTLVNVFDISQTDGKEPPFNIISTLHGNQLANDLFVDTLKSVSRIPIEDETNKDIVIPNKFTSQLTNEGIIINSNLDSSQIAKSLIDDYSEFLVKTKDSNFSEDEQNIIKNIVSYSVSNHFKLNTSNYNFFDIDKYSSELSPKNPNGIDLPEFTKYKAILNEASSISKGLIKDMEPVFEREYIKNRAMDFSSDLAYFIESYDIMKKEVNHNELSLEINHMIFNNDTSSLVDMLNSVNELDYPMEFPYERQAILSRLPFINSLIDENKELFSNDISPAKTVDITNDKNEEVPIKKDEVKVVPIEKVSKKDVPLEDFGEKIGGAKKDLWKSRGLSLSDLDDMNDAEKASLIKKDNVWPKPDYNSLVSNGMDIKLAYCIKTIRDALPTKPLDTSPAGQQNYIKIIGELKDVVMNYSNVNQAKNLYNDFFVEKGYVIKKSSFYIEPSDEAKAILNNKLLKAVQISDYSISKYGREIAKKQFCYNEEEKILSNFHIMKYNESTHSFEKDYNGRDVIGVSVPGGKTFIYPKSSEYAIPKNFKEDTYYVLDKNRNFIGKNFDSYESAKKHILDNNKPVEKPKVERKHKLVPKQLAHIERTGPSIRDKDIIGEDYLKDFNIKGGEFGNWLNDNDRQTSMNMAYEAFKDLATALNIKDSDIGLNNNLSIAFGARGSGNALAHYEPLREVINLTKMKGAGSLAHEYFHALDDRIGKELGKNEFITKYNDAPASIKNLVDTMKYRQATLDETVKQQNEKIDYEKVCFNRLVDNILPPLTEFQTNKKNEIIEDIFQKVHNKEPYNLNALNDIKENIVGKKLSNVEIAALEHQLKVIEYNEDLLKQFKDNPKDLPLVRTDYYNNSCKIDNSYSKAGHDYWQSTIEMAARAFSCYVEDKLNEMGIKNDYLTGHSESAVAPITNKDGETTLVKGYPEGNERKAINKAFDEVVIDMKKLGILHNKEISKNIEKKQNKGHKF